MTMTFGEHIQRAILETCEIYKDVDIYDNWQPENIAISDLTHSESENICCIHSHFV